MAGGWVYVLTNRPNGTLYVGVTGDLARRIDQHRTGMIDGFTKRYGLGRLVYVERHADIRAAIQREKNIKTLAARLEGAVDPQRQPRLGRPL